MNERKRMRKGKTTLKCYEIPKIETRREKKTCQLTEIDKLTTQIRQRINDGATNKKRTTYKYIKYNRVRGEKLDVFNAQWCIQCYTFCRVNTKVSSKIHLGRENKKRIIYKSVAGKNPSNKYKHTEINKYTL